MKTVVKIVISCFLFSSFLDAHALPLIGTPYAGVEGGVIDYRHDDGAAFDTIFDIYAGRFFVGYQFLQFFGFEAGYASLQSTRSPRTENLGPDHFIANDFDFSGKLYLPFACGFKLFTSAGVAYVKQDAENIVFPQDQTPILESHDKELLPLLTAGVSYNFNPHFGIRLSWMHYVGIGEIKDIDFIPLGLYIAL